MSVWTLGRLLIRYLRWVAEQFGFVSVSTGIFVFGFFQGLHETVFRLDLILIGLTLYWVNSVATSAMFTSFIVVTGLLMVGRKILQGGETLRYGGDSCTAIVPVYGDAEVLDRSVLSLVRSRYENLEVLIVCEPDDEESIERAEELAEHEAVSYIVNENPGSKAGAINDAMARCETRYVGVFDADHVVDPSFIPHAVGEI
ncbi:MAG: glycosyltransferase, partial [Candidatus Nanohaloarchaea archaeon]|nr:glycosyltransferase [Candidatus Nanohaloarchaea archaeon]